MQRGLPPFVDREVELEALARWSSRQRATPLYIYGPEGCGKTRLLREYVRRADELLEGDVLAVYIDALEAGSPLHAVLSKPRVPGRLIEEAVSAAVGEPVGRLLALSVSRLVELLAERLYGGRRLRGKIVVLAVDDVVKAIGVERVEWYVKHLYELMWRVVEEYEPEAFNIIVSTSEGESLELIQRHRHAVTRLLWNLAKDPFHELVEKLGAPESLDRGRLWRLLGGNPGKLVELAYNYEWRLDEMLSEYTARLRSVVAKAQEKGLGEKLLEATRDPDILAAEPVLREILVHANLVLPSGLLLEDGGLGEDRELGIGRLYAWQTPLYPLLLRKLLEGG